MAPLVTHGWELKSSLPMRTGCGCGRKWVVGHGKTFSGPWMEGTPPSLDSRLVSGHCQLGVAQALNPLPACCLLLWDVLRTPPTTQLQWFGPLWDPLQPGTWRTVSFPGITGGSIGSRDTGPMEGSLHLLHPHGYSSPPPYCLILWGVEWLSPKV